MVIGGQGFMPVEGVKKAENFGSSISRIPLGTSLMDLYVRIQMGRRLILRCSTNSNAS